MVKKYKAWCFTIRPINELAIKRYIEFIEKHDGGFCVKEGEGDGEHIHCGIFGDEQSRSNVNNRIIRIWKQCGIEGEEFVQRSGTKIMYNMDWRNEYLEKGGECLFERIPNNVNDYFPSEQEQQHVQRSDVDSVLAKYMEYWIEYDKKERKWLGWNQEVKNCLNELWYVKKCEKMPFKDSDKRQLLRNLVNYVNNGEMVDW